MVRRTKADAMATRNSLLDAAEHLFQARGVSRTSLNDIATAAGTTRGAVYHHFKDKADLFNAMMERVTLPLEASLAETGRMAGESQDPLQSLRDIMMTTLRQTARDEHTRRVFELAIHKVEYTDEMQAVRERHLLARHQWATVTRDTLQAAARRQGIALPIPLAAAALGLIVLIDGLMQNWILDPKAFDLVTCGRQTMDIYLAGLGFSLPATRAARRSAPKAATQPAHVD